MRWFACGWAPRQEGVLKVASRLRSMAAGFETIEPGLGRLWPQFEARRLRPGDPGPLTDLSNEELAQLIDRCARPDPPSLPAPVGPSGYSFALGGAREKAVGVSYGGNIWVESSGYALDEPVRFRLGNDSPVWRDVEKARRLLFTLVDAWDADWAAATAHVSLGFRADGESISEMRPWMAWAASGHNVPQSWVVDAGVPVDVRHEHGGQMSMWSWPPARDWTSAPRTSE